MYILWCSNTSSRNLTCRYIFTCLRYRRYKSLHCLVCNSKRWRITRVFTARYVPAWRLKSWGCIKEWGGSLWTNRQRFPKYFTKLQKQSVGKCALFVTISVKKKKKEVVTYAWKFSGRLSKELITMVTCWGGGDGNQADGERQCQGNFALCLFIFCNSEELVHLHCLPNWKPVSQKKSMKTPFLREF